jgi:hypothetical protein
MDPFQRETPLNLQHLYYPLGFPLQLKTNSADVLAAAEGSWGGVAQLFDKPLITIEVVVSPGLVQPAAPVYRGRKHLNSVVADAANHGLSDFKRHFAYCFLSSETVRDHSFVRYYFLEALANVTLTQLYLTPIHAACVAREGSGVLLCGPSGAGKTSLAYFCARNGWAYVSDNESWIVRERGKLVVGNPARIRFRESAIELFPELRGNQARLHWNDKMSIEIAPTGMTDGQCCATQVVFLRRQPEGPPTIRKLAVEEVVERFLAELPVYEDEVRREQINSLWTIAALKPIELIYSEIEDALRLLERL